MQNNLYCPNCGHKLIKKELEHEGLVPYCENCTEYHFPLYSVAVSMIILNEKENKILLIKQYNTDFYRFVAGYINKGEAAEEAVKREMLEEIGIAPIKIFPLKTAFFAKTETLMLNYLAIIDTLNLNTNYEIDSYNWFTIEEAYNNLKEAKLAKIFFEYFLNKRGELLNV